MPRVVAERLAGGAEALFQAKFRKDRNEASRIELYSHAAKEQQATESRQFYAAAKIQALVRGVLTRLAYAELKERDKAARLIQRIMRGKLGRIRWMKEYWRSLSVVKSDPALEELLKRSVELRISEKVPGTSHTWKEYFDPMTNCIWYYNMRTRFNTWICPQVFQFDLVCKWDGFEDFGALPSKGKTRCRAVFKTVAEYHNHLKSAHSWYCVSCEYKNSGLNFPKCSICGNVKGASGADGEEALQQSINKVRNKLQIFLSKDKSNDIGFKYNIRDRLLAVGVAEQKAIEETEAALALEAASMNGNGEVALVGGELVPASTAVAKTDGKLPQIKPKKQNIYSAAATLAELDDPDGLFLPVVAPTMTAEEKRIAEKKKKGRIHIPGCPEPIEPCFESVPFENAVMSMKGTTDNNSRFPYDPKYSSVASATYFKVMKENHEYHNRLEHIHSDFSVTGNIPPDLFDDICDIKTTFYDDDDDLSASSVPSEDSSLTSYRTLESILGNSKLLVCSQFMQRRCKRIGCPRAHPGLRDDAEIHYSRMPGKAKKVPYVHICPLYNGKHLSCLDGNHCRNYHIYIRPSTEEIIRKLYPIEQGEKEKVFASGCRLEGQVKNGNFNGYGVMSYNDGSCYMGDWMDNLRDGFGLFRSVKGTEYVGEWRKGMRHGRGVFLSESGEEYSGDWVEGRMEGVGQLTSLNGDKYEGHFVNNKYDGLGIFTKKNGDQYMGYFKEGMAQGLGVLALSTGEKYKGYFDRNSRHGKGVCSYRNGSRYAGEWYRGQPEGFGIYVSPQGEKYIGQWAAGKKHGKGRYYFANFDFYDGDFHKNIAKGMGVYYHANGNIYSGEWENDRRNGRGTYIFANGSKYTGYWVDNNMTGKGKFDFSNGNYFRGSLVKNKKHGKGEFTWYNGNVYRGDFVDDKMKGHGEMRYFGGHRYIGEWAYNKKNGKGTFFYSVGHIYDGDWVDDLRHGTGTIRFLANSVAEESYTGDWREDEIHGFGKYTYRFDDGVVYEGHWEHGRRAGKGLITYKDGSYYRGDFYKEQMWGRGVYVDTANGYQYDGEWRMNMRQGFGTEMVSDGSIYQGEFWANMRHGAGKVTFADGSSYEGTWEGNLMLGEGKRTILVGEGPSKTGPTEIVVRVFSY